MNCVILAAGYATRLRPLTDNFPKPLLPVGGRPILDWLLEDLSAYGGVDRFAVVTNHKFAGHFGDWAARRPENISVVDDGTSTNDTRLGAVNDMLLALGTFQTADDTLVLAGDNLLDFSLGRFLEYAAAKRTSCVMRYEDPSEDRLRRCGVLEVDSGDLVLSMEEKPSEPKSHWCCPPFYFYTAADLRLIPEAVASGCGTDAPGSLVGWLCSRSPIHAMEMPGKRHDIGDLKSYETVRSHFEGAKGGR